MQIYRIPVSKIYELLEIGQDSDQGKYIDNISIDSRDIASNTLFIDLSNNILYINKALENGAQLVITEQDMYHPKILKVRDSVGNIAGKILRLFYKTDRAKYYAITGTSGKSSTVHFIRSLLSNMDVKVASIGTLGIVTEEKGVDLGYTTPDIVTFHRLAASLIDQGYTHIVFEASSHGIDQQRIAGITIVSAGFVNFSHEHLDYHKTLENYFKAKADLFYKYLQIEGSAIINSSDEYGLKLSKMLREDKNPCQITTYGHFDALCPKDIEIIEVRQVDNTLYAQVSFWGKAIDISLNLFGEFQLYNVLCAVGILVGDGFKLEDIIYKFSTLSAPCGRMEMAYKPGKPVVFVDYAHKPDALEKILQAIKTGYRDKKIILVFGCGGDRDQQKRPIMGAIAAKYADMVIITDDNPRTEDPKKIREAIKHTCPKAHDIADRKTAIEFAISNAYSEDVIVIAGKGHEKYQLIGEKKYSFDDMDIVKKAIYG